MLSTSACHSLFPNMAVYGDRPIPLWWRLFFCHWTCFKPSDHFFVSLSFNQHARIASTSRFARSTDPCDWEWRGFPCTIRQFDHISTNLTIILFTNSRPLSDCRINGDPSRQNMSNSWDATSSAVLETNSRKTKNFVR